ncbi:hypothetical protein [Myroides odoratus]|uniref:lectin-like domain-containing protein n=1 Tax=Myroides odoratus TaxID=256 RepID=UPI0033402C07
MKRNRKRKVKFIVLGISLLYSVSFYAQFPYFNSGQKAADFKVIAESRPGLVKFNQYGINLTHHINEYAGVYLENLSFTPDKGFILEFEYAFDMGIMEEGKYGDGLTMVLFDANESNPSIGDRGGALGYAATQRISGQNVAGFTKGIFGLGLDIFGNYKRIQQGKNEIRNGLTNLKDGDFIALRGPYDPRNEFEGYPVLFAIGTKKNANLYLDTNTGEAISKQKGFKGNRFSIRNNALVAKPGQKGYRKVQIAFVPGIDDVSRRSGFFIFVDLINGTSKASIIRNYFVPKSGTIKYQEQVKQGETSVAEVKNLAINIPNTMKMGFTASTGGAYVRTHVRNISLSLPFCPKVQDIIIPDVIRSRPFVCQPLYSAFGYDTNVYKVLDPPSPSTLFLDFASFRFKVFDESTKNYVVNSMPYQLVVPRVGEFNYNTNTGEVTFTAEAEFKGTSYTFYYDIKNKQPITGVNIGAEEYRSTTASVTLNFTDEIPLYRNPPLLINKGVKKVK